MAKVTKTNVELVNDMMNFSKAGGLKQAFIIEAIASYSKAAIAAPPWEGDVNNMLSQDSWKICAEECLKAIEERK